MRLEEGSVSEVACNNVVDSNSELLIRSNEQKSLIA